jgi:hypothetical protein
VLVSPSTSVFPRLFAVLVAALTIFSSLVARAQPAPSAAPVAPKVAPSPAPDGSWATQLDALSKWFEQQHKGRCAERCYVLDRLKITGRVGDGALRFELTGSVLAEGAIAVPLFGPPSHVRIDDATEDGKEAVIGFEGDRYFLHTASKRFTLKGALSIDGDLALTIPGPLNTLEADVTAGAVVEGSKLTGLTGATVHFSREGAAAAAGPTVFQLSRAVRVGREIGFEYRLVMRSGADLGVVRLPLAFGEKVLDVTGASGWRVEDKDLVLPTSGRTAEIRVSGSFAQIKSFSPDPRSSYEWWLLESDPEHRIKVTGDARQVDSAESPIARTQATSRLFLVQKGQRIEVSVTPLAGLDVLAAVVRSHHRRIVLTQRGDLVSDDTVSYENNGIDYLLYAPDGRPIYLATDGKAERIMHQGKETKDVLVPLRTGSHSVRVQALAEAAIGSFGGRLDLPMPTYPLTASRVDLSVGLPARVVPVALLGGDKPAFFLSEGDLVAIAIALVAGWLAVRVPQGAPSSRALRLRLVAGAVLAGLWFLSAALYVAVVTALVAAGFFWVLARVLQGTKLAAAVVLICGFIGFVGLVGVFAAGSARAPRSEWAGEVAPAVSGVASRASDGKSTGNFLAQTAAGGVLEGVTPVALSMPSAARTMRADRELVTRDRAFHPVVYYVTDWVVGALSLVWLVALVGLLAAHRAFFKDLYTRVRDRLQRGPLPPAPPPESPEAA